MDTSSRQPIPPILPKRRVAGARATVVASAAVAVSLALGACSGESDSSSADSTSTDSESSAALTMTVADFVPLATAEKQSEIETVVAASPQCDGLHADKDFLITVSVRATDGPQDRPVARLIRDACTP